MDFESEIATAAAPARAALALALCAAISAQGPAPAAPQDPPIVTVGRTVLDVHTESMSRELFSACDRDGDDRLDLFEACEAIETLGDPKDPSSFLAIDDSRDGYLQWPEFDAHYKSAIERGGTFRARTCRRFVRQSPELKDATPATPLEIFLQLHDANENGGLDPEEIQKLVRDIGLHPAFESQLKMLDLDHSGLVEPLELAPVFERIRSVAVLPGLESVATPSGLPPPWGDIDADGDRAIDLAELTAALRRLDPGLQRWAETILKSLDADGDAKIADKELPGNTTSAANAAKKPPGAPAAAGLLGALRSGG